MNSILYCIEEEAIVQEEAIIEKDIQKTYEKGLVKKKQKIQQAKILYDKIKISYFSYQNECYFDTIIKGIPVFFQRYNLEFDAQNSILTLDYPFFQPIQQLSGIDLILEYLERIYLEQLFLNKFSSKLIINHFLFYHQEYTELIFNICELIFQYAIASVLLKKPVQNLEIDKEDIKRLEKMVQDKSIQELEKLLEKSLVELIKEYYKENQRLFVYFQTAIKVIAKEWKIYADSNNLWRVFFQQDSLINENENWFKDGISMKDSLLRNLIEEMQKCRFLSDKLSLLKEKVKSLADLKEVMAECFIKEEYKAVFDLFSDEERKVLIEEIKIKKDYDNKLKEWEIALMEYENTDL